MAAQCAVPPDSLYHRYREAYREFTWEGVWGSSGLRVLTDIRTQTAPTCIYEAVVGWMECHARLAGLSVRLSAKDLQEKEQALKINEKDRTARCLHVVKFVGIRSEADYNAKNHRAAVLKFKETKCYFALYEPHFREAVQRMEEGPLLLAFRVGQIYDDYVLTFQQRPVLSFEARDEGNMRGHGVCTTGYGVESVVPYWKFMNSVGKKGPTKGFGRVLPQNATCLVAGRGLTVRLPNMKKRDRQDFEDAKSEDESDERPLKKIKLDHPFYMDVDNIWVR